MFGFDIPVKWVVIGLLALAVGVGAKVAVDAYNAAISGKAEAEAEAKKQADAVVLVNAEKEKLQEMGRLSDELTAKAKKEAEDARAKAREFEEKLRGGANAAAVAGDPSARDWLAAPVPPLIRGMRRAERASGDRDGAGVQRPNGKAGPDAGTGTPGRDERRPPAGDRRGERLAQHPQVVQQR